MADEKIEKIEKVEYESKGFDGKYLVYKGKPLVRKDNFFLYGDMSDDYVLEIVVFSTKKIKVSTAGADGKTVEIEDEVPDLCLVMVNSTDMNKSETERNVFQQQANGLYNALDLGIYWMNKNNKK